MILASANKLAASFRDLQVVCAPSSRHWMAACHLGIWIFVLSEFRKGPGESRRKAPQVLVRGERTRSY